MPRLAVVGQPVSHSRSPAMHTAALTELGLAGEWSYEAIEVSPEQLESRLRALPRQGFAGVNVTVPHKVAALALADRASPAAMAIGAANTLSFAGDQITADNTDAGGLLAALPSSPTGQEALVLGGGGAARAAVWALREAGARVSVWNRTAAKAERVGTELGAAAVAPREGWLPARRFRLIVNATTVGMDTPGGRLGSRPGAQLKALCLDAESLGEGQMVVDLVYGSRDTALIAAARARGAAVVDGLDVLVHQGAASLRLWTGMDAPVDVMRRAAREIG